MAGPLLGYQVDRSQHCLQSATRALRNGEDDEMVVAALLHDVGDPIAPENHSAVAADILRPYVSDRTHWIIRHHGLFQGYYYFHHLGADPNARDQFREHKWFDDCAAFCAEYDQNCFERNYDEMALEEFEPLVREVFARQSRFPIPVDGLGLTDHPGGSGLQDHLDGPGLPVGGHPEGLLGVVKPKPVGDHGADQFRDGGQ